MSKRCTVLVITPPPRAPLENIIADIHPPLTQGIDSVPLRLASVLEQEFSTAYLPLYHLQYSYYILDEQMVRQYLRDYQPALVVIANDYLISNRTTACFAAGLQIAAWCKDELPEVRTVFVGKHAIVRPREHFAPRGAQGKFGTVVDVVVAGEPEDIIVALAAALLSGNTQNLASMPGVYYQQDGEVRHTGPAGAPPDVNRLPPPAYHLLREHLPAMLAREKPYCTKLPLTLRTSYGCLYQCPFCAGVPHWRQYRTRSAQGVAADVDAAQMALGNQAEFIFLDDELFTLRRDHVHQVAEVFASRGIMLEGALTHVQSFDEEIASAMARFCRSLIFGAENFDDSVLASLEKNQSREMITAACEIAHAAGLRVRLQFVVGLPDETPESIVYNLNFIYNALTQKWVDEIVLCVLCPHPGTAYGETPEAYGITVVNHQYEEYIEEGGYPTFRTSHLSRTQIYLYYLLAQRTVKMALANRHLASQSQVSIPVANCSPILFRELFSQIGDEVGS